MRQGSWQKKLAVALGILFVLSFTACYAFFDGWLPGIYTSESAAKKPVERKPRIKADTRIAKALVFACNDKVYTTIPTTSKYIGMDFEALAKEFPPEEGWEIDDSVPNELIITRHENKVCPYHREFRHLGIDEGFLAIYEGPLGYNDKVLQRENVAVYLLPPEIQEDLNMAMNYNQQDPDTQARLKSQLEFEDENKLSAVLENFDEYKEE
ncbi:hypothetical protein Tfer_0135 [Thermincola ferriacetica]|uniref:Bypass of forespore C C-terminal domain-containing protein n=2 Tax=Thermincola TaxID=278993 RepID=D5XEH1_THEPJ|nr:MULTISPECIES: hypothetical protein [Thermincola]ADG82042.1 hypothetical protein TherJR_1178 [Thermincola potens JR]KNZ71060.1 hypothetical protein Tfer_0135 [Thermincola ferriacetica]